MRNKTLEDREKLYGMIRDIRITMLTTTEEDGTLHTRPMSQREVDDDGTIWFFVSSSSALTSSVKRDPEVSLGYSNPDEECYVAISGEAEVVNDARLIDEKWTEELKAWFPNGKGDPDVALLKIRPLRGEYWDSSSSTLDTVIGYLQATFSNSEKSEKASHHRKVDLGIH